MKILHLSTHDVTGGAARAAHRLHAGLRRAGHDSKMLVFGKASEDPDVIRFQPSPAFPRRVERGLRRRRIAADRGRYAASRPAGYEMFSDDRTEYAGELSAQLPPADVVNLHWIAGFLDHRAFFSRLPAQIPVVWTLHDMNAFTGGCHYDGDCGKFEASCGACCQLGSEAENDLSRQVWRRKKDALAGLDRGRVRVVADSRWLAAEARRSSLLGRFPVSTIHYGLDTAVFAPRGRSAARAVLGIPEEARVLLFVADSVENRRKGFPLLAEALRRLEGESGLFLVSIGRGTPQVTSAVPHLHLDQVGNDHFLSIIYSAADLFVLPSLQEAFGQTALEALSCGTPAVGFEAGGIPDIIRPGETGMLAPTGDTAALADALARLLADPGLRARLGENGRRVAVEEHDLSVQARRYAELYEELAARRAAPKASGGAGLA